MTADPARSGNQGPEAPRGASDPAAPTASQASQASPAVPPATPPATPTPLPGTQAAARHTGAYAPVPPPYQQADTNPAGRRLALLSVTALGVVYGDIGTSPLYALRECFNPEYGLQPNQQTVYGVLSLIIWALILIVSVKYIVFIMRADNRGEGGILALLALLLQQERRSGDVKRRAALIALGLFGAALLYGDGVITPAVTVLSSFEGLRVAAPGLSTTVIVALSVVILTLLFGVQRLGTSHVGIFFGPVMLLWFLVIGVLGLLEIVHEPHILGALSPWWGVRFFLEHGEHGFLVLGAVVLAVTGAEALYADMGHFGKRPIRVAWFAVVLPCLLLNYFGQGALLLRNPAGAKNPFYYLSPSFLVVPLVILATLAAIIASQALISGAFSLTQQSVQLGYSPRMTIVHTSKQEAGQIYIREVNNMLWIGCVILVLAFKDSSRLAAAYGIAVTGTMAITSILFYVVARSRWGWPLWKIGGLTAAFLFVDIAFFAANTIKIERGGWVPIVIAIGVYTLMSTWKRGRNLLNQLLRSGSLPIELFLQDVERRKPHRVPGTAVFMTSSPDGAPVVLLHHLKHNKVLHEKVVLMSVQVVEIPEIAAAERVSVESLGQGFYRVRAHYGFMETPNVREILARCAERGLATRAQETSWYLGRERLVLTGRSPMMRWRKKLFALMSRNARSATEFFGIPPNRVVELGAQIEF